MIRIKNLSILFTLVFVFVLSAKADSWALPEERTVCSENNKFCLKVIPKKLESQLSYFQDKVDGKENAGANKKAKENYCKGIFYVRDNQGVLREKWRIKLINEVSPVNLLISNQGDYVITFDNWHSVGFGDDVVVIYETSKGSLIKKIGLSDFLTDSDIENLPASISSIHWGGKHSIDKEKKHLVLQVTKGKRSFEKDAEFFEVRVELSTGKILDEKRDRFPSLQFLIDTTETNQEKDAAEISKIECFEGKEFSKFASADFLKKAAQQEKPTYFAAAKAVRATGKVTIEVLVNEDGEVECVRPISGHPLLRPSVVEAVKKWKFERNSAKYVGVITFEAKPVLISPDGKIIE